MTAIDRSVVTSLPLFAGLHPTDLDEILADAHAVHYPKNGVVFAQGGDVRSFFILLDGYVRAARMTPAGQQVVVRYVSPGEMFGVAPAIGLSQYPATATAVDDSVVLTWPASAWPRLAARFPVLAANTLAMVGSRLQDSQTRVVEMSTEQVERRIARAILRLTEQAGRAVPSGIEIDFPISRQDIAEMTGTTLHTVSRILSGWDDRGLIDGGRQRIVVRDRQKLAVIAEGDRVRRKNAES